MNKFIVFTDKSAHIFGGTIREAYKYAKELSSLEKTKVGLISYENALATGTCGLDLKVMRSRLPDYATVYDKGELMKKCYFLGTTHSLSKCKRCRFLLLESCLSFYTIEEAKKLVPDFQLERSREWAYMSLAPQDWNALNPA